MESIWKYDSPLGEITLAGEGDALTGLWLEGQGHSAEALCRDISIPSSSGPSNSVSFWGEEKWLPVFGEACKWLDIYFSGRDPGFTPRMELRGTPFRKEVWEILLGIPYGSTMTYGEIAEIVGYHSADHFSRVFRSQFCCSPQEYRRTHVKSGDRFIPFEKQP